MAETPSVNSGFVEVSGVPLYYEVAGSGPTLVLLHEGLADSRMYDNQFAPLSAFYRVVRYDLPGYGRSGTPTVPYTHHEALHTLLQHLGITQTALLGMSLGGSTAIDYTLTYPNEVSALLLLASGINGYPISDATRALAAPAAEAFQAGDFPRAIELMVRLWFDGTERQPDEVDPVIRERFRSLYTDYLKRTREQGREPDQLDPPSYIRVSEIHVPTLIVVGTGDVPSVVEGADYLAQHITGSRKVVLPRLAHLLNMEQPAEVNSIILGFLKEVYGTSTRS